MINWPWAKTYSVTCADGSTRQVYKDINVACPLFIPGWKADVTAEMSGLGDVAGAANGKYETQIHGMLFALNEQNQSLMMSFRAIYLAYQTNPCGADGFFQREIEKLLDEQRKISALKIQIAALIQLISANPHSPELTQIFGNIANRMGGPSVVEAASLEIAQTREIAKCLVGGGE